MRTEPGLGSCLVLAAAVLLSGQSSPARKRKADADMVQGRLIRMDLLERVIPPYAGTKRDPFGAGSFAPAALGTPMSGSRLPFPGPKPQAGLPAGTAETPGEAVPIPVVDVRYVGFVQGKEKLLALVLYNGQAVAVAAGEMLGDVWKVTRVSAAEIEIQGPDGAAHKFALEGERK